MTYPESLTEKQSFPTTDKLKERSSSQHDREPAIVALTDQASKPGWSSLFLFTHRSHIWCLIAAVVSSCVVGLASPTLSYLLGRIINHFTTFGGGDYDSGQFIQKVRQTCGYLAILGVVSWLAYSLEFGFWLAFGGLQARTARERLFVSFLQKGVGWYDLNNDGISSLSSRFQTTTSDLQKATSLPLGQVVRYSVDGIASFALAMSISWKLTLVTISPMPLSIITLIFFSSRVKPNLEKQASRLADAGKWAITSLSNIESVKFFNGQNQVISRYVNLIAQAANMFFQSILWNAGQTGVVRFIALSMIILSFWYGGELIHKGELTTADVVTTFYSAYTASKTCLQILPQVIILDQGKIAGSQLGQLEQDKTCLDNDLNSPNGRPDKCLGSIKFENVSFRFPRLPGQYSLENANISIPAGQTVFLTGASGSGKSTISQLLLGFYPSYTGRISIDGHDLRDLDRIWVRQAVTVVEQQSTLFSGTIEQNIQLGSATYPNVLPGTVVSATEFASLTETISQLPGGLATLVGNHGKGLSGGQNQRVALARAWMRNTPILILDESTSALDYVNRTRVMSAVREWRRGKTTIVITHDMAIIKPDDRVYVLDSGKVIANGLWSLLKPTTRPVTGGQQVRPQSLMIMKNSAFGDGEGIPGANIRASLLSGERLSRRDRASLRQSGRIDRPISHSVPQNRYPEFRPESSLPRVEELSRVSQRNRSNRFTQDMTDLRVSLDQCLSEFDHNTRPWSRLDLGLIPQLGQRPLSQGSFSQFTMNQRGRSLSRLSRVDTDTRFRHSIDSTGQIELSELSDQKSITQVTDSVSPLSGLESWNKQLPRKSLFQILSTVWPNLSIRHKVHLIVAILAATVCAVCTPVFSYVFSLLIQSYYRPTQSSAATYCLVVLAISFIDGLSSFILQSGFQSCGQRWVASVRTQALSRILVQPREFFDQDPYSVSRLGEALDNHAENMQNILGRFIGYVHIVSVMIITALIWSFSASWKLTLVALGATPVVYGIILAYERVIGLFDRRINDQVEVVGEQFLEVFAHIRTVRALLLEDHFREKYFALTNEAYQSGIRKAMGGGILAGLSSSSFIFFVSLINFCAAEFVRSNREGVPSVITVINILVLTVSNVLFIVALIPHMSGSKDSAARLLHLADLPAQSHESVGKNGFSSFSGLSVNDLNFSYPSRPEHLVLRDVSFTVSAGSCVAIVGSSGSGKSTIGSLLLRLYKSCSDGGEIRFNGLPLQEIETKSLRQQVVIVSQTTVLFPMSVTDNIIYGLDSGEYPLLTSIESIERAAREAGIHDFIISLPEGYGTLIGEGGLGLSGGQTQRIGIARALVRQPEVLILDEATSALDPENARLVRRTVASLLERRSDGTTRTVIIITHAREMMAFANKVIVLDQGEVVQTGGYDELLQREGPFQRLLKGENGLG